MSTTGIWKGTIKVEIPEDPPSDNVVGQREEIRQGNLTRTVTLSELRWGYKAPGDNPLTDLHSLIKGGFRMVQGYQFLSADESERKEMVGDSRILVRDQIPQIEGFSEVGRREIGSEPVLSYSLRSGAGPAGPGQMFSLYSPDSFWENSGGNLSRVFGITDPEINTHIDTEGIDRGRLMSIGLYSVTYEFEFAPKPSFNPTPLF